jgi:hypothetical protein
MTLAHELDSDKQTRTSAKQISSQRLDVRISINKVALRQL